MDSAVRVIEVLGPGCVRCRETHRVVVQVAEEANLGCSVVKTESIDRMVALGLLATPGIAIDGRVVHQGSVPKAEQVRRLLGLPSDSPDPGQMLARRGGVGERVKTLLRTMFR